MNKINDSYSSRKRDICYFCIILFALFIHFYIEIDINNKTVEENTIKVVSDIMYFLAMAFTVHMIYDWFLRKQELEQTINSIKNNIIPYIVDNGFLGVHQIRIKDLLDKLDAGDDFYWLDTYCPGSYNKFSDNLERAVIKGANVKILTINPESENAQYRAEELINDNERAETVVRIKGEIESWQRYLRKKYIKLKKSGVNGNFDVEHYTDLPGMPIYIHVRKGQAIHAYTGFYLNRTAANYLFLEWQPMSSSKFIDDLKNYVDEKWIRNNKNLVISLAEDKCLIPE